ncbi:MAG: adenylate/guanylate cyclase domain-containing protein, partial [Candidatus Eremiobacteraeota bacterium]|nr:adenylate/guanylate cyclase domain-containing protein [Candidatus Eremiobacteraeota bacterium]
MTRPSGTVTFLFSDIEGSTQRWERHPDAMSRALLRHDELLRAAIEAHGGYVFKVLGDAFCSAFSNPADAIAAALRGQRSLIAEDFSSADGIRVRMALHTGSAEERNGDYLGSTLNRAARLLSIGHGGQVLISGSTADLLPEGVHGSSLRDLGSHRLKDLIGSQRVYQLVAPDLIETFPALRSLENFPNNLPFALTSFVGRGQEVSDLKALIKEHRLLTLVGPGGAGKTRCAIQVGADVLEEFEQGVWLVDLAALSNPSLVTTEIAKALAVREVPNHSLLETLAAFLERRRLMLIVDNCEHVIDEARKVIAAILRGCKNVHIVATSRESLNIGGEQVFRLPSLPAPDAIALFVDRARGADSSFHLTGDNAPSVEELAARLDGIPLAIELAAARVRMMSPQQLAKKLDERFRVLSGGDRSTLPRHRTMRALIDWSYDLLDEPYRALFRRLAVFAGGWTLQAATQVCAGEPEGDGWETFDALSSLVDKSLVVVEAVGEERRYRMLQSIREYALERLRQAGEISSIATRHARYYAGFVRALRPLVEDLEDVAWRQPLELELDNLRAAIEWTIFKENDPALGRSLLADLEWPELITTPQEALTWFEAAAAGGGAAENALLYSRLLRHCVLSGWLVGRPVPSLEEIIRRELDAAIAAGDANETARALANLGACYRSDGRFAEAEKAFAEAYAAPQSLSRITANAVLRLWAVTDLQRGNIEDARTRFSQVAQLERHGSEAHASALLNLGELEFAAGNIEAARDAAQRAKSAYVSLNSVYLVLVLSNLGGYALAAGDLAAAREALHEALMLQRKSGSGWVLSVLEHHALLAATIEDFEGASLLAGFTARQYDLRGEVRQYTERRCYERLTALLSEFYSGSELSARTSEGARL